MIFGFAAAAVRRSAVQHKVERRLDRWVCRSCPVAYQADAAGVSAAVRGHARRRGRVFAPRLHQESASLRGEPSPVLGSVRRRCGFHAQKGEKMKFRTTVAVFLVILLLMTAASSALAAAPSPQSVPQLAMFCSAYNADGSIESHEAGESITVSHYFVSLHIQWDVPQGEAGHGVTLPTDVSIQWTQDSPPDRPEDINTTSSSYRLQLTRESPSAVCTATVRGKVGGQDVERSARVQVNCIPDPVSDTSTEQVDLKCLPASASIDALVGKPASFCLLPETEDGYGCRWYVEDAAGHEIDSGARDYAWCWRWSWAPPSAGDYTMSCVLYTSDANGNEVPCSQTVRWTVHASANANPVPEILACTTTSDSGMPDQAWTNDSTVYCMWNTDTTLGVMLAADNDPSAMTYQWQSRPYLEQVEFANIPGATDPTYTVVPPEDEENVTEYRCVVAGGGTTAVSSSVACVENEYLKGPPDIYISSVPSAGAALGENFSHNDLYAAAPVKQGTPVQLSVIDDESYGFSSILWYYRLQWEQSVSPAGPYVRMNGETGTTLTVEANAQTNGMFYRCTVANILADPAKYYPSANVIGLDVDLSGPAPSVPSLRPDTGTQIVQSVYGPILTGIEIGSPAGCTTVADVKDMFSVPAGDTLDVLNGNKEPMDADSPIGTGDQIVLTSADGMSSAVTVVIPGDVLGTGRISLSQLVRMVAAFTGENPLSGVYSVAADLSGDGALNLADIVTEAQLVKSNRG